MKAKDKKKAKRKPAKKRQLKDREKQKGTSKKVKKKGSVKALGKQVRHLTRELKAKEDEIHTLRSRQMVEENSNGAGEDLPDSVNDWAGPGSAGDRKRTWERHQYLRARYEHHLAAGQEKPQARSLADKDLRERYGEDAGYTEDQLEGILS